MGIILISPLLIDEVKKKEPMFIPISFMRKLKD